MTPLRKGFGGSLALLLAVNIVAGGAGASATPPSNSCALIGARSHSQDRSVTVSCVLRKMSLSLSVAKQMPSGHPITSRCDSGVIPGCTELKLSLPKNRKPATVRGALRIGAVDAGATQVTGVGKCVLSTPPTTVTCSFELTV
jgi:hypothetical protein